MPIEPACLSNMSKLVPCEGCLTRAEAAGPAMAAMWCSTQNEVVSRVRKVARCCCVAILALLSILSPAIWAERLPMRLYTTEDGLWSDILNYMMRDSRGFIWFYTRDGLSRFDGYGFTNYRIGDNRSSQNFTYMYESRDGIFWIALGDGRLYRYDPRTPIAAAPPAQTNQPNND